MRLIGKRIISFEETQVSKETTTPISQESHECVSGLTFRIPLKTKNEMKILSDRLINLNFGQSFNIMHQK